MKAYINKRATQLMKQRITILFLLWCTAALSQQELNYNFRHIDQINGLLHNTVYSIEQDGKGFIWIATTNGLQRYDGSVFLNYTEKLSNPAEGFSAGVEISADKKKNLLWIKGKNNIEKMELGKTGFNIYSPEKLLKDSISVLDKYNGNNESWLLGRNALYYYDKAAKTYSIAAVDFSSSNTHAWYKATESSGRYTWFANFTHLYLFDKERKKVYSDAHDAEAHPLLKALFKNTDKKNLWFVMIDKRQNIWVTTWGDILYKYDNATKKVITYSLSAIKKKEEGNKYTGGGLLINCMMEDDDETIWVGTENAGLLRYNRETDKFDYCIARERNSESIQYDYKIFSLFQDREQNIWVGTDKGISIFNPYRQYFKSIRHEKNNPLSISKSEIISFIQTSNGDIFIGTWGGGIGVYDNRLNFKKNIVFNAVPEKNLVWSLLQVDDNTLWIGCQHGYLLVYNMVSGSIKTLHPPEMGGSTIRCMENDNKGNVWFGLHNGKIVKWDRKQDKMFPYSAGLQDSLKTDSHVTNIFIDPAQHCWVSTEAGFKEFDLEKRVYTNTWLPDKNNVNSISGKSCQGIEEYNDSTLLIGTVHGGLNFFNKRTKTFSHLTLADGLPSNTIYAIKKDTAGYVWFTTDYGLYKFNPAEKKFIPYNMEPGIINSSFISNKFYPLQDGQWLTFTLTETISLFPYKAEYQDNRQPKIEITGFKIFDKPVFIDSLLFENKPARLSYKENFFTIEFAALNFSSLHQANYYYRLGGIDKDWVNGGTKRFASYTNLDPGEYIFEAKTDNGNSSGEITSFKIIITPPFWKTWWFILIISFCTFLIIYRFIKLREKNIKAIEAEKLKVQQLNAEQYRNKLEMEQIVNYFSSSLINKNTRDDVLWDVAKNLIGKFGFVDCMIYLWNNDKTKMIQKAGFGPKGSIEEIAEQPFDVVPGQGVVGYVMQTKESVLIPDTSKDTRYRPDEMVRLSEIAVPVIYNDELIGVIDSEHHEKNFFTQQHLQILSTIATLMANKIKSIEAEQLLLQTNIEMYSMNELLSKAKLEALRSQMNPHFIFNCLNSIDNLIQMDEKEKATLYLSKFAKLIRSILENSAHNEVSCWKDMETLNLYLQLEELRWDKKFSYQLVISEEILNGDYKVPPLIIQPFVENAIHHGLLNKIDGDKKLMIHVSVVNNHIHYVIEDNGVGRAKANAYKQLNKPSHQSMGMQITTDRINLYNQNKNGYVMITDLVNKMQEPCGTKVEIDLINQS
jgi:ligand-binding sensor domain-containing protein/putative methionine-R-sulfoxide reductase with GAF domain